MIFTRYYNYQDSQRNNENVNKFDCFTFNIYVPRGKDSFLQYKDGYKEKRQKIDIQIVNCKIENRIFQLYNNHHEDILSLDNLVMILWLLFIVDIYLMLYIQFGCFKHVLNTFFRWKNKQYWCNMSFFIATKAIGIFDSNGFFNVIFRLCYIKTYRLSTFVVPCLLDLFYPLKTKETW